MSYTKNTNLQEGHKETYLKKLKETAKDLGSTSLSSQTRNFMSLTSRVMKKLSFYL